MIKKKKILVTGAAGFIGSHLVDRLLERGYVVYGLDDLSGGYLKNIDKKCRFSKIDLRQRKKVEDYIKKTKPEIIFHLAADATEGRSQFTPLNCTERNYLAYMNLIVPAIRYGMKRMVLASSMSVYGAQQPPFYEEQEAKPEDIYAISKASMEGATKILSSVHGFEYVIIRPHNVYGPKQNMADPYRNVVAIFINRLLAGKPFYIYGDGEQKRCFTFIDDCVNPFAEAGFLPAAKNQIFNVGPGGDQAVSINELKTVIFKEFFKGQPVPEKLQPIYLPDRPLEVREAFSTHEKAEKILGYKAKTSLSDGIAKMIAWARKNGYQKPIYLDKIELPALNLPQTWKKKLI